MIKKERIQYINQQKSMSCFGKKVDLGSIGAYSLHAQVPIN